MSCYKLLIILQLKVVITYNYKMVLKQLEIDDKTMGVFREEAAKNMRSVTKELQFRLNKLALELQNTSTTSKNEKKFNDGDWIDPEENIFLPKGN